VTALDQPGIPGVDILAIVPRRHDRARVVAEVVGHPERPDTLMLQESLQYRELAGGQPVYDGLHERRIVDQLDAKNSQSP